MTNVIDFAEQRARKRPLSVMSDDDLAETSCRMEGLAALLMEALYDIRALAGAADHFRLCEDLRALSDAIETTKEAAELAAFFCDNELIKRIVNQ